jgi:hypothetical protein
MDLTVIENLMAALTELLANFDPWLVVLVIYGWMTMG